MINKFLRWLIAVSALSLLSAGLALAQQEPTMNDIYAAAQAGRLSQAQSMVQQVLVAHPNSAKAHFVQSELYARQGNMSAARESLSQAERIAPGLPFAKPQAVQALRNQLYPAAPARPAPAAANGSAGYAAPVGAAAAYAPPPPPPTQHNWLLPALLAGGAIIAAYFLFRPRRPEVYVTGDGNALSGPQTFGSGLGSAVQPTYGPSPYGQPGYAQPQGSGLGGRIMGGVATGLAVGAGMVAAEAIGRNLMGEHEPGMRPTPGFTPPYDPSTDPNYANPDMGGQNFGISDTSWDDGGSGGGGGGGSDWDN